MHISGSIVISRLTDILKNQCNIFGTKNLSVNHQQIKLFEKTTESDDNLVFLKDRRTGISTALIVYCYDYINTNYDKTIVFIGPSENYIKVMFSRLSEIYQTNSVKYKLNQYKNTFTNLETNSTILFFPENSIPGLHGKIFDLAIYDECFSFPSSFNRFKTFETLSARKLITWTLFELTNKPNDKYYCGDVSISKYLWGFDMPNIINLPVYLCLMSELTENCKYKGVNLIENGDN